MQDDAHASPEPIPPRYRHRIKLADGRAAELVERPRMMMTTLPSQPQPRHRAGSRLTCCLFGPLASMQHRTRPPIELWQAPYCLSRFRMGVERQTIFLNFGVFKTTLISVAKAATINRGHVDKDYLHVVLRMPTTRGPVFTPVR